MLFNKRKLYLIVLLLVLLIIAVVGCSKTENKKIINIATGGTAGTYYPLGVAIADILNNNLSNVQVNAQSTGATIANINMLKDGSVDMAFVQNDIVYYAVNGLEMFEGKKINNLKGLITLYPESVQIITLQNSGINKITDLKGKRLAVGPEGSGTEANTRQILKVHGLDYQNVTPFYMSFAESVNALVEKRVDVVFVTAGVPTLAIEDLAKNNNIKMIGISGDKIQELMLKYPFYSKIIINKDGYYGLDESITTVAVRAMLVANNKIDDKDGYNITKAILNNSIKLEEAHMVGRLISKAKAKEGMPIEMNDGAVKCLEE